MPTAYSCRQILMAETIRIVASSGSKTLRFWCKRQERGIFGVSTPLDEAGAHAEH
jgi:hypothetical protein